MLQDSLRQFRLQALRPDKHKGGAKGKAAAPTGPPTHALVYVAAEYPAWQRTLLGWLAARYSQVLPLPLLRRTHTHTDTRGILRAYKHTEA